MGPPGGPPPTDPIGPNWLVPGKGEPPERLPAAHPPNKPADSVNNNATIIFCITSLPFSARKRQEASYRGAGRTGPSQLQLALCLGPDVGIWLIHIYLQGIITCLTPCLARE